MHKGERVGLVGESGSGKSSLGKLLLGMEVCNEGEVTWKGRKLDVNDKKSFAEFKRGAQPVFQDPFNALNPKMKVGTALEEALSISGSSQTVASLLLEVGLSEGFREISWSFSGGKDRE